MRRRFPTGALALAMALIMTCGAVLAQAPDHKAPKKERRVRDGKKRPAPDADKARNAAKAAKKLLAPLMNVLGRKDVKTVNTDRGIAATVNARGTEAVAELQQSTAEAVAALQKGRKLAQKGEARNKPAKLGGMGLLLNGTVATEAVNTDTGVRITFSSARPEAVQHIQQIVPLLIERAGRTAARRLALQRQRTALKLLADENVTVESGNAEGGITITITSGDAATRAKIRDLLKNYFQDAQALAKGKRQAADRVKKPARKKKGAQPQENRFDAEMPPDN